MRHVKYFTFGCKVNFCETGVIAENLRESGYTEVSEDAKADIFVINSCTVTAEGEGKVKRLMRKLAGQYPSAVIVLVGCLPQASPDMAEQLELADVITGTKNKMQLAEVLDRFFATGDRIVEIPEHTQGSSMDESGVSIGGDRTRSFFKIQDGCNKHCTYCIIPKARGNMRSLPLDVVEREYAELKRHGYKEVVLTGINLTSYGMGTSYRLIDAIESAQSAGIERIRLGSMEPEQVSESDIERMSRVPALCRQFHLALQSGSDAILKKMGRRYTAADYLQTARIMKKMMPDAVFTTDIMVGFPGETDEDFERTLDVMQRVNLIDAHIFRFSARTGTPAARFHGQIQTQVKRVRARRAAMLAGELRAKHLSAMLGSTQQVLIEGKADGEFYGYTKNYVRVNIKSTDELEGENIDVVIADSDGDELYGIIL